MNKQITIKSKLSGITLSEVLIYLGLFALVFTGIIQFLLFIGTTNKTTEEKHELEKTFIFIDEHIAETVEIASSIDEANSTFDSNNGKVRFNITGGYAEYSISNNRLNYNLNGTSTFISPNNYRVSQFRNEKILDSINNVSGIRTTITIYVNNNSSFTRTYETAYTIQN
jgi:hypothetical protein